MAQVRQNYKDTCEAAVNKQINMELTASYIYHSIAFYFDRDDVALPGLHKFFKNQANEEREHAEKLMKFQNARGGRIVLQDVKRPEKDEWGSPLEAIQFTLRLERSVNDSLIKMHKLADESSDGHMTDFIESEYLDEQVKAIKELGDMVTNLKRVGNGLGEYLFDRELEEKLSS